jgi:hypothetical protein
MTTISGPNVLIFEDQPGPLAIVAHALVREGYAVSYAAAVDEATLLASEWAGEIRVLVFPDHLRERALAATIGVLKSIPRMIAVGAMPSAARRGELFELGVSWGIWDPPDFGRLRTALDVALELAPIAFGQTPFIATRLGVRLRNAGDSEWSDGTLHVLTRNGAFLETTHRAHATTKLELVLEAPEPPVVLKGRLAVDNSDPTARLRRWPRGIGVALGYPDDAARARIHALIDADARRFHLVD